MDKLREQVERELEQLLLLNKEQKHKECNDPTYLLNEEQCMLYLINKSFPLLNICNLEIIIDKIPDAKSPNKKLYLKTCVIYLEEEPDEEYAIAIIYYEIKKRKPNEWVHRNVNTFNDFVDFIIDNNNIITHSNEILIDINLLYQLYLKAKPTNLLNWAQTQHSCFFISVDRCMLKP